ncbi:hypothetical protein [Stenotrophomonas humi]
MTLSIAPGHAPEPAAVTEALSTPPVAVAAAMAPMRRQQLLQLELAAQQEITLLRAQCTPSETPDWLTSSIDWDLSAF